MFSSDFFASQFMKLVLLARNERLTRLRLLEFLRLYSSDTNPETRDTIDIIEQNDYWRIRDTNEIARIVECAMRDDMDLTEEVMNGGRLKSFNKMRNSIVNLTKKCIEIEDVEMAMRNYIVSRRK